MSATFSSTSLPHQSLLAMYRMYAMYGTESSPSRTLRLPTGQCRSLAADFLACLPTPWLRTADPHGLTCHFLLETNNVKMTSAPALQVWRPCRAQPTRFWKPLLRLASVSFSFCFRGRASAVPSPRSHGSPTIHRVVLIHGSHRFIVY